MDDAALSALFWFGLIFLLIGLEATKPRTRYPLYIVGVSMMLTSGGIKLQQLYQVM